MSTWPSWHCRARPVCNVRLRRFKAMENRGVTLRERRQAARTFMRVFPLPVPAMSNSSTPLSGYASLARMQASAAASCQAKRPGPEGRSTASSAQGESPSSSLSGCRASCTMRRSTSEARSDTMRTCCSKGCFKAAPPLAVLANRPSCTGAGGISMADTV